MSEDNTLTVALVTSHLIDAEEYPEEPCVILTGSKEAVKEAGRHFDTAVSIIPQADLAAKDAEIARLRGALAETAAILQAEAARATGQPFTGEWNIPSLGVKATVGQALDRANAALATEGGADA